MEINKYMTQMFHTLSMPESIFLIFKKNINSFVIFRPWKADTFKIKL